MQVVETGYGVLIEEGGRVCGPDWVWRDTAAACKFCFNSTAAADLAIASLRQAWRAPAPAPAPARAGGTKAAAERIVKEITLWDR